MFVSNNFPYVKKLRKVILKFRKRSISQGGFTGREIPYHVGSYWGIYIEEKMT